MSRRRLLSLLLGTLAGFGLLRLLRDCPLVHPRRLQVDTLQLGRVDIGDTPPLAGYLVLLDDALERVGWGLLWTGEGGMGGLWLSGDGGDGGG